MHVFARMRRTSSIAVHGNYPIAIVVGLLIALYLVAGNSAPHLIGEIVTLLHCGLHPPRDMSGDFKFDIAAVEDIDVPRRSVIDDINLCQTNLVNPGAARLAPNGG